MTPAWTVALVVLNIAGGLALESWGSSHGWMWAESVVDIVTILHFALHLVWPPIIGGVRVSRAILVACLSLATFGELVLSAGLGLYSYRQSVLPFFVPPGHVLLFLAGLSIVSFKPSLSARANWQDNLTWSWSRSWNWDCHWHWMVPSFAGPVILFNAWFGLDHLSLPLFILFLACLMKGTEPALYAVMFVLALLLELYGTALGTWTWAPVFSVAFAGRSWAVPNPPIAAGVFYAVLDLLTVALAQRWLIDSQQTQTSR